MSSVWRSGLPGAVREMAGLLLEQIDKLNVKIRDLEKRIRTDAGQDEEAKRLMSIPGVGPIKAMAIQAFAPPMEGFGRGRDFPAWLGLVPRQHSTGGKQRLGRVSKMGQSDLRRLLFVGAMANRMARMAWALMTKKESYRDPVSAAA